MCGQITIIIFITLFCISNIHTEIFSSVSDFETLLKSELDTVAKLEKFVESEYQKTDKFAK